MNTIQPCNCGCGSYKIENKELNLCYKSNKARRVEPKPEKVYKPIQKKPIKLKVKEPIKPKPQPQIDSLFSQVIKKAHPSVCVVCGANNSIQCGHYLNRTKEATRYDLTNALPVCEHCNYFTEHQHILKEKLEALGIDTDTLHIKQYQASKLAPYEKGFIVNSFRILLNSLTDDYQNNFRKLIEVQRNIDLYLKIERFVP